ncbi:MAG: hypothetical protein WBM41_16975, partial [Arenicellales bacterium]
MNKRLKWLTVVACMSAGFLSPLAWSEDQIQLVMTGTNRAIVLFNGERLVLSPGDSSHSRIALIEATSGRAVLSVDGERVELDPDSV